MKRKTYLIFILVSLALSFYIGWKLGNNNILESQIGKIDIVKQRPLDKYTIENLSNADIKPGKFEINKFDSGELKEKINEDRDYTSYLFTFEFNPNLDGKTIKKTTGQINLPSGSTASKFSIIVMLRGYINQETFQTGDGTRRAAEVFAKNGFITIAPDFLGYGGSDEEEADIFETRFQTYVTILSLLQTLENSQSNPGLITVSDQITKQLQPEADWPMAKINQSSIFLWGHSNGGQIALTILEITGEAYPTTLWAPVSKQFPYSVLYYTDQSEDRGKLIRHELSEFEKDYNPDLYSLDLYLDRIKAPIQIHQGLNDDAVPYSWSDRLVKELLNLNIDYYKYPGADHNMNPVWNTVVSRDLEFFKKYTK